MSNLHNFYNSLIDFLSDALVKTYLALRRFDKIASASHPKSWLFHLISYFLLACGILALGISPWFVVGAAIAQEYEQFLNHFTFRNWYDFAMDLLADATALFLAVKLMQGIL